MAFSFTPNGGPVGLGGGLKAAKGVWTGAAGDSGGSVTLNGGVVWSANFQVQGASDDWETIPYTWTASSGVITLTVANRGTVSDGRYIVFYS